MVGIPIHFISQKQPHYNNAGGGESLVGRVLTDDGHEGVEIADVETLLSYIDEELDDTRSLFLLHRL